MDTIHSCQFCPTCQNFTNGSMEFTGSSGRKYFFNYLCTICLIVSDGFFIRKKDISLPKPK